MDRPNNKTMRDSADERGAPGSDDSFARGAADDAGQQANAAAEGAGDAADAPAGADVDPRGEAERQLADQRERYLRLAAEYDNFRKRTARERTDAHSRGQADLVRQLLDPLDDLARFAHVDPATVDPTTLVQGVDMVERKLHKLLTGAGLEAVNPVNQTFDPNVMEAVATEPALSPEDDHVVSRVYQQGYLFNGQLLRPARVVVKQWNG